MQGQISDRERLQRLQAVPGQVSAQLGLTYTTDSAEVQSIVADRAASVEVAERDHQGELARIEAQARADRTSAYQGWQEQVDELRGTWYAEQVETENQRHANDLARLDTALNDQLQAVIDNHGDLTAADQRYLADKLATDARLAASLDSYAQLEVERTRQRYEDGALSYEQYIARLAEIARQAQQQVSWLALPVVPEWGDTVPRPREPGQDPTPYAAGGAFRAYELMRVGEYGEELVMFNQPGAVIPNNTVQAMRAPIPAEQPGSIVIESHIHLNGSFNVATRQQQAELVSTLQRAVQQQIEGWVEEVRATRRTQL
jgi:hypothetical protein